MAPGAEGKKDVIDEKSSIHDVSLIGDLVAITDIIGEEVTIGEGLDDKSEEHNEFEAAVAAVYTPHNYGILDILSDPTVPIEKKLVTLEDLHGKPE